jgi:predicted PurR-regulated permease PerM
MNANANTNIVRRMLVNGSNDIIPLLSIKNDNYALIALFIVSILIVCFIQAADQLGEKISNTVINLRKETSELKEQLKNKEDQLKKKEDQLEAKDKMIELLELALKNLTEIKRQYP